MNSILHTIFLLLLLVNTSYAESPAMAQTKNKLKQLETKMTQLQHHINHAHDQQSVLQQDLTRTEQQIHNGVGKLKVMQHAMEGKQRQITQLQQQANTLSQQLRSQQQIFAEHIRARYKMRDNQPVQWLFNQSSPHSIDRLMTFYQYLVHSRQLVMDDVKKSQLSLSLVQKKLNQELLEQQQLEKELTRHQQELDKDKRRRLTLIQSIAHDIQNKQQTLQTYQQNKANLSRLLNTLTQQSVVQTRRPFAQMRRKLQKPLATNSQGLQKINQGVVFFADEGTPVMSVFPGKVVFSDWLNGYGLLLIVDHGWGFMTLYANNKTLLKHRGDIVNQGEKISIVGHTGTLKKSGLYFEIRQRGRAVNPLEWMS